MSFPNNDLIVENGRLKIMQNHSRRNFIKKLTAIGTAAFAGSSFPQTFARSFSKNAAPFNMLVLGDSIMWGQGLLREQKFFYQVNEWLKTEILKDRRAVNPPHVEAHSGATIFPEFDEKLDFTKRYSSGETNVSNPSIIFQAFNALEHYQNQGESESSVTPEKVDLILVNGGINDFNAGRLFHIIIKDEKIQAYARQFCGNGMKILLRFLTSSFPKAKIVVTGYYSIISTETDPNILRKTLSSFLGTEKLGFLFNIPFYREHHRFRDELARRSYVWRDESDRNLLEAVRSINKDGSRVANKQ